MYKSGANQIHKVWRFGAQGGELTDDQVTHGAIWLFGPHIEDKSKRYSPYGVVAMQTCERLEKQPANSSNVVKTGTWTVLMPRKMTVYTFEQTWQQESYSNTTIQGICQCQSKALQRIGPFRDLDKLRCFCEVDLRPQTWLLVAPIRCGVLSRNDFSALHRRRHIFYERQGSYATSSRRVRLSYIPCACHAECRRCDEARS